MERHTAGLALVALLVLGTLAVQGQRTVAGGLPGDVTCDGSVDTIDATFILQRHASLIEVLPCPDNADANVDGSVTAVDAALVLQYSAGLVTKLPRPADLLRDIPECSGKPGASDATIIVNRMLTRSSTALYLDLEKRNVLRDELHAALDRIREAHPDLARIHARPRYESGVVTVTPEKPLADAIQELMPDERGLVTFVTGYADFDELNARLRLRGVHRLKLTSSLYLTLCFDDHLNVPAAAAAYRETEGVWSAGPNSWLGDGPDIEALRSGETWYVIFRDAWGDCPSGCLGGALFYFTVLGDRVAEVDVDEARADPHFAEVLRRLRETRGG